MLLPGKRVVVNVVVRAGRVHPHAVVDVPDHVVMNVVMVRVVIEHHADAAPTTAANVVDAVD